MPSQIARHLAAAGGMADVNGVLQVEMRGQRRQVIGIVIHVVAVADLGGAAVAAAVMRDDAIAVLEEEQHLRVPVIGRQRPAMAEHDGLTFAPVLVENLNAVFGWNRAHTTTSLGYFSSFAVKSTYAAKSAVWASTKPIGAITAALTATITLPRMSSRREIVTPFQCQHSTD